MRKATFLTWLRAQRFRNDAIGDLTRDWIADDAPKKFGLKYLENKNVDQIVIEAYKKALEEYNQYVDTAL